MVGGAERRVRRRQCGMAVIHRTQAAVLLLTVLSGASRAPGQERVEHVVNRYRFVHWYDSRPADARALMPGPGGKVWAGFGDGTVRILEDRNGDGIVAADEAKVFVAETWNPHGLAWRTRGEGREVFVCHTTAEYGGGGRITCFIDADGDDAFETVRTVIRDLPPGAHQVNNIALDPGGEQLWFSQGATADATPGGGALVGRVDASASDVAWGSKEIAIVATGLRNAWGLAFHPDGALFATDNGRDDRGDGPPDELDLVLAGRHYGFPEPEGDAPAGPPAEPPVAWLDPHGSACGLAFDRGGVMSGFRGQVFIAHWGSWKGAPGSDAGTKVSQGQLHRDDAGRWHYRGQELVARCGRPLGVLLGAGGELYVSLQNSGPGWPEGVWRVAPADGIALRLDGLPAEGRELALRVHAPGREGHACRIGISLGRGPISTPRGDLGLSPDAVFRYALEPGPFVRVQRPGRIGPDGISTGPDSLLVPGGQAGRTFFLAAVTADPATGALTGISPTVAVTILAGGPARDSDRK